MDLACTSTNPGSTIQRDYFDFLPTFAGPNYATLVDWIADRAKAKSATAPRWSSPTANPLPGRRRQVPEHSWLYPEQTEYLASLVDDLNGTIRETVEQLGPRRRVRRHLDPYSLGRLPHLVYRRPLGLRAVIYKVTDPDASESGAPFHPVPQGQDSIAASSRSSAILGLARAALLTAATSWVGNVP